MIFRTKNSTYELDPEARRVRLVSSNKPHPGRRHGWRFFKTSDVAAGRRARIWWGDGTCTTTTEVSEVRA